MQDGQNTLSMAVYDAHASMLDTCNKNGVVRTAYLTDKGRYFALDGACASIDATDSEKVGCSLACAGSMIPEETYLEQDQPRRPNE